MVLRARWILGGAGETEGDEEAVAEEEEEDEEEDGEGEGAGTDLLLPGPETLILALPGDNVVDVEGEGDIDGRDFAACPAAGLFGEDVGDCFSPSSPALEASFPDNIDAIPPMGSVFLASAVEVEATLSSFT